MTGGEQLESGAGGLPSPNPGTPAADVPPPPDLTSLGSQVAIDEPPELPSTAAIEPPPTEVAPVAQPTRGSATWYRTDQDRYKSVRRRANPWYRRTARGLIAASLLGVLGVGLYFGAREAQDFIQRDRLPSPGADIPDFAATSFQVTSSSPAPAIDGTLTIDVRSGAFEFVARDAGPQSGLQVVSPDGGRFYVRRGAGTWRVAGVGDNVVSEVRTAVSYLIDVDNVDDLLTNRIRNYVDLVERVTEGTDENQLTRYEMNFDTADFSDDFPLQWTSFRRRAIPGVVERTVVPVTMWIDRDDVLVRLQDTATNWAWERLTYVDEPFRPDDPAEDLLDATTADDATATDDASDDAAGDAETNG